MKKILRTLLMLTCVFSLTACTANNEISEMQKQKLDTAKVRAEMMLLTTCQLVDGVDVDVMLGEYNNMELAAKYEAFYAAYIKRLGEMSGEQLDTSLECDGKAVRSAMTTFSEGIEAVGGIQSLENCEAVAKGDDIVVTFDVVGVNGATGNIEVIMSNDIFYKISSCTFNLNESFGEMMKRAALNTLLGVGTVFFVLVLISLIIAAFGIIPKLQKKKQPVQVPEKAVVPVVEETAPVEEEDLADDMELVAVIAAAIAAYEGTAVEGFRVRSIKRANTNNWKKA